MNNKRTKNILRLHPYLIFVAGILPIFSSCSSSDAKMESEILTVSAITVEPTSMVTFKNYPASLEGISNIEIRPQADGYLKKIFVEEGAYVKQGQPLFQIEDNSYKEKYNDAAAAVQTAKANALKARIEVDRLQNLVEAKVISKVQLDNAKAVLDAENANIAQASAVQKGAEISKAFTLITAPVGGYLGRIPYKVGSLIGRNDQNPLTVLSDIHVIYAYFSMSETDFLEFKKIYKGNTVEDKIKNIPKVTLILPDESEYPQKGKIEMVQGQFDKTTAAITFKASFPNANGLLRSGNTGSIVLPQQHENVIKIPQQATFELQNKVMAYIVGTDNKLRNVSLKIAGKDEESYIVSSGLKAGDRVISKGLQRLKEGISVNIK
ncbi:efflux RND transporter periplasmic adaptor subunit [Pedobacter antarcticus]|uniref:efflux RND transporter periplasmic adaptor subunit n=1 Tax=Pedobacter antarcticus TaxID=34086 RepID=UPI0029306813|nr:efflux RND transporter periplasmic adaptor subunit [Pedobacter antarcticus]